MKKDSAIRVIGLSVLAFIVLWLAKAILFPSGHGRFIGYRIPRYKGMHEGYDFNYGFNMNYSTNQLFPFLIKTLLLVFLVALAVGIVMLVKNHVFNQEGINRIKGAFTTSSKPGQAVCSQCGKILNDDWKVCPHCGKEIEKI